MSQAAHASELTDRDSPASPASRKGESSRTGKARARTIGLVVALGCWSVLAVAAWLRPDSRGYDTHTQLGLSPCAMPQVTGLPCPTCGMTTAFAHVVRGHVVDAARTQAFGAALAVAVVVVAVASTVQVATGRNLLGKVKLNVWAWLAVAVGFLAAWGVKLIEASSS